MSHSTRIGAVVKQMADRYEKRHGTLPMGAAVEEHYGKTPFDEVAEMEEAARAEAESAGGAEVSSRLTELRMDARMETLNGLMDFIFRDGPHPAAAMRRLYVWVKKFRPDLMWEAGFREIGALFGEDGAHVEWRLSVMIDEYLEAKGARNVKMPWQRQEPQCAIYANSQLGNANRTGGARSGKAKAAKPGMN